MSVKIVHISTNEEWKESLEQGEYRSDSLKNEGFIHCSKEGQVLWVANSYYPKREDLILMWIDTDKLAAELRWEKSEGDVFPHLYGPLNLDAVLSVKEFPPNEGGIFIEVPAP